MAFDGRMLTGISVLAAVVDGGSFAKAADVLGLTPSGVSRAIGRLEERLGIRLFERTTRSLRLTDDGERFYRDIAPLLDGIAAAAGRLKGAAKAVRGRLRVNIDPYVASLALGPQLGRFCARYPDLDVELYARSELGDLVADGMDLAIRFGDQSGASLVARKLFAARVLTVAAPRYLAEAGTPRSPEELQHHRCIQFRDPLSGKPFDWEFRRGQEVLPVAATGPLMLTDVHTMLAACVAGAGIAQILDLGVRDLFSSGALVELFPDWPDETFPLYAVTPARRHSAAKVRAFVDFCREVIGQEATKASSGRND